MTTVRYRILTGMIILFVAHSTQAREYVKFTCLKEAQNFAIEALRLDDEVAFDKSPQDLGVRIIKEAKRQQIYPAWEQVSYGCSISDGSNATTYKFEVNQTEDKIKFWYGNTLLMDLGILDVDIGLGVAARRSRAIISKIRVNYMGLIVVTIITPQNESTHLVQDIFLKGVAPYNNWHVVTTQDLITLTKDNEND